MFLPYRPEGGGHSAAAAQRCRPWCAYRSDQCRHGVASVCLASSLHIAKQRVYELETETRGQLVLRRSGAFCSEQKQVSLLGRGRRRPVEVWCVCTLRCVELYIVMVRAQLRSDVCGSVETCLAHQSTAVLGAWTLSTNCTASTASLGHGTIYGIICCGRVRGFGWVVW